MRTCPVCKTKKRELRWQQTYLVPDGFTLPKKLDWYVCRECGMIYADNDEDITQRDYNTYYLERYGFGVEDAEARARQQQHAAFLAQSVPNKSALVVDFGGAGVLSGFLRAQGFTNVVDVCAGDAIPQKVEILVAEHVLEHIYDLPDAMQQIADSMVLGGLLIVDGPEAGGMAEQAATPMLDFQQKHVNHFTFYDYLHLMRKYGFEFMGAQNYTERKHACVHMLFGRAKSGRVMDLSLENIQKGLEPILAKLRDLVDREVIVWGCGDIALHCLSLVMPNVKYFVDKDPAFRGTSIAGRWVYDTVKEGETAPILVIAQGQKHDILMNIKRENLNLEVILP